MDDLNLFNIALKTGPVQWGYVYYQDINLASGFCDQLDFDSFKTQLD